MKNNINIYCIIYIYVYKLIFKFLNYVKIFLNIFNGKNFCFVNFWKFMVVGSYNFIDLVLVKVFFRFFYMS